MRRIYFGLRRQVGVAFWVGATLLVFGASLFVRTVVRAHTRNLQPLVLPVSLAQGTITTPAIRTDLDARYDIILDIAVRDRQDNRLSCLLGEKQVNANPEYEAHRCDGIPSLVDISWEIFDGGSVVAHGNSSETPWADWSATVERMIGRFPAQRGRNYTLVLQINRDASELNSAHPKIRVQIPHDLWEDYAMGTGFEELGAIVLVLVGGMIVFGRYFFLELRRRKPV